MEKMLSGKPVANSILDEVKNNLLLLKLKPTMALIIAGDDPASSFYVKNIFRQTSKLEMNVDLINLSDTITTPEFISRLSKLNDDSQVHGIMIQKPFPRQLDEVEINNTINPDKDIDGINPINMGKLFLTQDCFVPCTAAAVLELIKHYEIETQGRHIVILGRSAVVAKPLAGLLLQKSQFGNATVTICHSYTKNLEAITRAADILVTAIGKPHFVKSHMITEKTICLDVGINLIHNDEKGDIYVGDIDYEDCFDKALAITPVPGGIGSITTSILLKQLLKAAKLQEGKEKKLT
ncbi:MAG: bifunctional 5,10-methylenetetrahydrofolate dehydrogenase/5,10-methenyltetrahydrofolate cyclohydrolase [Candidatus Cloacimonadaceae bacterium]